MSTLRQLHPAVAAEDPEDFIIVENDVGSSIDFDDEVRRYDKIVLESAVADLVAKEAAKKLDYSIADAMAKERFSDDPWRKEYKLRYLKKRGRR